MRRLERRKFSCGEIRERNREIISKKEEVKKCKCLVYIAELRFPPN